MSIQKQRIKKLEKSIGVNMEDRLFILPSEWEGKIDVPSNYKRIMWISEVVIKKYGIGIEEKLNKLEEKLKNVGAGKLLWEEVLSIFKD